ncbi:hypothetical protein ACXX82_18385 [Glaciimonas sp. GNP009]
MRVSSGRQWEAFNTQKRILSAYIGAHTGANMHISPFFVHIVQIVQIVKITANHTNYDIRVGKIQTPVIFGK